MAISVCRGTEDRAGTANCQAGQKGPGGLVGGWREPALRCAPGGGTVVLSILEAGGRGSFKPLLSLGLPNSESATNQWVEGPYRCCQAVMLMNGFRAV